MNRWWPPHSAESMMVPTVPRLIVYNEWWQDKEKEWMTSNGSFQSVWIFLLRAEWGALRKVNLGLRGKPCIICTHSMTHTVSNTPSVFLNVKLTLKSLSDSALLLLASVKKWELDLKNWSFPLPFVFIFLTAASFKSSAFHKAKYFQFYSNHFSFIILHVKEAILREIKNDPN